MKNKNNFFDEDKHKKSRKLVYNSKYPIFEIIKYKEINKNKKEITEITRALLYNNQFYEIDIKYSDITFMDFELKSYKNIDITDLNCELNKIPYKKYSALEKLMINFVERGISKIIIK